MWRLRQKEKDERLKGKSREESSSSCQMERSDKRCSSGDEKKVNHAPSSSDKRWYSEDDEGLGDDEIESFLQSRYVLSFHTLLLPFEFASYPYLLNLL